MHTHTHAQSHTYILTPTSCSPWCTILRPFTISRKSRVACWSQSYTHNFPAHTHFHTKSIAVCSADQSTFDGTQHQGAARSSKCAWDAIRGQQGTSGSPAWGQSTWTFSAEADKKTYGSGCRSFQQEPGEGNSEFAGDRRCLHDCTVSDLELFGYNIGSVPCIIFPTWLLMLPLILDLLDCQSTSPVRPMHGIFELSARCSSDCWFCLASSSVLYSSVHLRLTPQYTWCLLLSTSSISSKVHPMVSPQYLKCLLLSISNVYSSVNLMFSRVLV